MFKFRFLLLILVIVNSLSAQQKVVDKVIGVVGKYPVLLSDLQNAMLDQDKREQPLDKCKAFEIMVFQKLLLAQADRDSVTVSDGEVEQELNRRMNYFIQQFGSEEKLESYYGKRTNVIKDDLRADVKDQLLQQRMISRITGDVKITPAEVRNFYNSIPQDSLPLVDSEVELQQIVKKPVFSESAKQEARERLEGYRQRVLKGESSMRTLARLYSEDPGSASNQGGLIENIGKGMMVPEFEAVAFKLKAGEISEVFETTFGYHFIELEKRKGELLDLRHILVIPKMSNADFFKCKNELDSIYEEIKAGNITFEEAARKYSDDKDTKQNGGLMVNPSTASTKFDNEDLSQMDQNLIVTLNSMQPGDIGKPMQFTSLTDGKPAWRLLKLKNRIDPHKTNLKDDYQKIVFMATNAKNETVRKEWIKKRSKATYIKLDPEFYCKFENDWVFSAD
jgi:peptidyl-prolyl cis-trans isomerase SurA